MATPNSTGKAFEQKCLSLVKQHRAYVTNKVKVPWSPANWYEPDALTETEVFEFKYQQVGGSVKNKLTQAMFELNYMAEVLELQPVLVYDGTVLEHFVANDPAFLKARSFCTNIQVFSYQQFHGYLTASSNINDWEQNRLLEYA